MAVYHNYSASCMSWQWLVWIQLLKLSQTILGQIATRLASATVVYEETAQHQELEQVWWNSPSALTSSSSIRTISLGTTSALNVHDTVSINQAHVFLGIDNYYVYQFLKMHKTNTYEVNALYKCISWRTCCSVVYRLDQHIGTIHYKWVTHQTSW